MITLEEARALKVGDPILLSLASLPSLLSSAPLAPTWVETTVTYIDAERLHVLDNGYQFFLENCQAGIEQLSFP